MSLKPNPISSSPWLLATPTLLPVPVHPTTLGRPDSGVVRNVPSVVAHFSIMFSRFIQEVAGILGGLDNIPWMDTPYCVYPSPGHGHLRPSFQFLWARGPEAALANHAAILFFTVGGTTPAFHRGCPVCIPPQCTGSGSSLPWPRGSSDFFLGIILVGVKCTSLWF